MEARNRKAKPKAPDVKSTCWAPKFVTIYRRGKKCGLPLGTRFDSTQKHCGLVHAVGITERAT